MLETTNVFAHPVESLRCKAAEGDREARRKIAWEIFGLQREDGSWTVVEDRNAISDADCRVEYVYIPTYYATAARVRAGDRIRDREAVFYTRKESRDLIDILLLAVR